MGFFNSLLGLRQREVELSVCQSLVICVPSGATPGPCRGKSTMSEC